MIPGEYEIVARQGYAEVLAALDFPAGMVENYVHPENKTTWSLCLNKDGSYSTKQTHPKTPELNESMTFKLGEEFTSDKPVPMKILFSKVGENKYLSIAKIGSTTAESTLCFNNYGVQATTTIQGKGVTGCEIYKKVDTSVDGYYVMETEKNAVNFFLATVPADKKEELKKMFNHVSLSFRRRGNQIHMVQRYGDFTKKQCVTLDEEYSDSEPALGIESKNLVTETGPGSYKIISKDVKNGSTMEIDVLFTNDGILEKGVDKKTGNTFEMTYRRGVDMEGKWKMVSASNAASYLEMLGVPEPMKTELIDDRPTLCISRQPGNLISVKSSSKFLPDMVNKLGEEFTIDYKNGLGTSKAVMTECNGELLCVIKFGSKTISQRTIVTGDFSITEAEVDGNIASRMKTISIREDN